MSEWQEYDPATVGVGEMMLLIHPKIDGEAHLIEVHADAERAVDGEPRFRLHQMFPDDLYYLNVRDDYTIAYWRLV